jgi:hypothetical protein
MSLLELTLFIVTPIRNTNSFCERKVENSYAKTVVHIVTTGLERAK